MRGSVKLLMRIGVAPPPNRLARVVMSELVAHCMKIQAASLFLLYLESARLEPPWWLTPGVSSKPHSDFLRRAIAVGTLSGSANPTILDFAGSSKLGKNSPQEV